MKTIWPDGSAEGFGAVGDGTQLEDTIGLPDLIRNHSFQAAVLAMSPPVSLIDAVLVSGRSTAFLWLQELEYTTGQAGPTTFSSYTKDTILQHRHTSVWQVTADQDEPHTRASWRRCSRVVSECELDSLAQLHPRVS